MEALAGLLTGGSSLLGSIFTNRQNAANAQQSNMFNYMMALQQQAYQTQMSNTAYQRATADMKAAGLNPALMFGSGQPASVPAGAGASATTPHADNPAAGVSSAFQAAEAIPKIQAMHAGIDNTEASTDRTKMDTHVLGVEAVKRANEARLAKAQADKAEMETHDYSRWGSGHPWNPKTIERGVKTVSDMLPTPAQGDAASARTNRRLDGLLKGVQEIVSPPADGNLPSTAPKSPYGSISRNSFYSSAADNGTAKRLRDRYREIHR